jgi:hypothetical protein
MALRGCRSADFVQLGFDSAELVASHLGGLGGRCQTTCDSSGNCTSYRRVCQDPQPAAANTSAANSHLLFRNVGSLTDSSGQVVLWLRVTNETECTLRPLETPPTRTHDGTCFYLPLSCAADRAWNPNHNGIKRVVGDTVGYVRRYTMGLHSHCRSLPCHHSQRPACVSRRRSSVRSTSSARALQRRGPPRMYGTPPSRRCSCALLCSKRRAPARTGPPPVLMASRRWS